MNKLKAPSQEDVDKKIPSSGGKMGNFFGTGENGSINITGVVIILLVVVGGLLTFINFTNSMDYWKTLLPLLTLGLGYLFGRKE